MGSLSLLQRILPTQESNWGLLHYRLSIKTLSPRPPGWTSKSPVLTNLHTSSFWRQRLSWLGPPLCWGVLYVLPSINQGPVPLLAWSISPLSCFSSCFFNNLVFAMGKTSDYSLHPYQEQRPTGEGSFQCSLYPLISNTHTHTHTHTHTYICNIYNTYMHISWWICLFCFAFFQFCNFGNFFLVAFTLMLLYIHWKLISLSLNNNLLDLVLFVLKSVYSHININIPAF